MEELQSIYLSMVATPTVLLLHQQPTIRNLWSHLMPKETYGLPGVMVCTTLLDSGITITQIAGVDSSFGISFGAAAPATTYPAIYLIGHVASDTHMSSKLAFGLLSANAVRVPVD